MLLSSASGALSRPAGWRLHAGRPRAAAFVCSARGKDTNHRRRGGGGRSPNQSRDPGSVDDDDDEEDDDHSADPAAAAGPYAAYMSGGYVPYGDVDAAANPDAAALADTFRARQLAATRRARAAAAADAAAAAASRSAGVEAYLASRGLGSIAQFREMADQELARTLEELEEADLAALEAQVAAAGGDLEADWAALERGRSTTGMAKQQAGSGGGAAAGAGAAGGSGRASAALPDDTLLAPPSNPRVERIRAGSVAPTPRRKRRLFDTGEDGGAVDSSFFDGAGSSYSSGSDDEYDGSSYSRGGGYSRPSPAAQAPRPNPFLILPKRPEDAPRGRYSDMDELLDNLYEEDGAAEARGGAASGGGSGRPELSGRPARPPGAAAAAAAPSAPSAPYYGHIDDEVEYDGVYDEYGNRIPDKEEVNSAYGDRMLRALRNALVSDPDKPALARPQAPGAAAKRKPAPPQAAAAAAAPFGAVAPAAADGDYDALMELLESVGDELVGEVEEEDAYDAEAQQQQQQQQPSKRPLTTTALLKSQPQLQQPGSKPQLAGRPDAARAPGSAAQPRGGSRAAALPGTAAPAPARVAGGFAEDDARFLEDLLDDVDFMSDLGTGTGTGASTSYGRSTTTTGSTLGSSSSGGMLGAPVRAVRRPAPGDPDYDPLLDDDGFDFDDDDLALQGTGLLSKPALAAKPAPRSTAATPPTAASKGASKRPSLSQASADKARSDLAELLGDDWGAMDADGNPGGDAFDDLDDLVLASTAASSSSKSKPAPLAKPQLASRPVKGGAEAPPRGAGKGAAAAAARKAAVQLGARDLDSMMRGLSGLGDDEDDDVGGSLGGKQQQQQPSGRRRTAANTPSAVDDVDLDLDLELDLALMGPGPNSQQPPRQQEPLVAMAKPARGGGSGPSSGAGASKPAAAPSPRTISTAPPPSSAAVPAVQGAAAAPVGAATVTAKTQEQRSQAATPAAAEAAAVAALSGAAAAAVLTDRSKAAVLERLEGKSKLSGPPPRKQQQQPQPSAVGPPPQAQKHKQESRQPKEERPAQAEPAAAGAALASAAAPAPVQAPATPDRDPREVALAAAAAAAKLRELDVSRASGAAKTTAPTASTERPVKAVQAASNKQQPSAQQEQPRKSSTFTRTPGGARKREAQKVPLTQPQDVGQSSLSGPGPASASTSGESAGPKPRTGPKPAPAVRPWRAGRAAPASQQQQQAAGALPSAAAAAAAVGADEQRGWWSSLEAAVDEQVELLVAEVEASAAAQSGSGTGEAAGVSAGVPQRPVVMAALAAQLRGGAKAAAAGEEREAAVARTPSRSSRVTVRRSEVPPPSADVAALAVPVQAAASRPESPHRARSPSSAGHVKSTTWGHGYVAGSLDVDSGAFVKRAWSSKRGGSSPRSGSSSRSSGAPAPPSSSIHRSSSPVHSSGSHVRRSSQAPSPSSSYSSSSATTAAFSSLSASSSSSVTPIGYSAALSRLRQMVVRGEVLRGYVEGVEVTEEPRQPQPQPQQRPAAGSSAARAGAEARAAEGAGGLKVVVAAQVNFPALAQLGVRQPVRMPPESLHGWRDWHAVANLVAQGSRTAERGAEDKQQPQQQPDGDAAVPNSGSSNSSTTSFWPSRKVWGVVTSIKCLVREAEAKAAAAAAGGAAQAAYGASWFEVCLTEPMPPSVHYQSDESDRDERQQIIRSNTGAKVLSRVLGISRWGAFCELQLLQQPEQTRLGADGAEVHALSPEEAQAHSQQERALQVFLDRNAAAGSVQPQAHVHAANSSLSSSASSASATDSKGGMLLRPQLCYLPLASMAGPLAAQWDACVAADGAARRRAVSAPVGARAPASRPSGPDQEPQRSQQQPQLLQVGHLVEATVRACHSCPTMGGRTPHLVVAQLQQAPYSHTPALSGALDY